MIMLLLLLAWQLRGYWLYPMQPEPIHQTLFPGVTYQRLIWQQPRPVILHLLTFELHHAHLQFVVTPPNKANKKRQLGARTTSTFLEEFKLQLAINGSYFYPFQENIVDSYPKPTQLVTALGLSSAQGKRYGHRRVHFNSLYLSDDNQVSWHTDCQRNRSYPDCAHVYNAIAGKEWVLWQGQITHQAQHSSRPYPRTLVAADGAGQYLWWLLADGKQPGYSEGITLLEAAQLLQQHGAATALNLDGGGSTTLVRADKNGRAVLMNTPIHQHIPNRERPIANHLGVRIHGLAAFP